MSGWHPHPLTKIFAGVQAPRRGEPFRKFMLTKSFRRVQGTLFQKGSLAVGGNKGVHDEKSNN